MRRQPIYLLLVPILVWGRRTDPVDTRYGRLRYEQWCFLEANRIASQPNRVAYVEVTQDRCRVVANDLSTPEGTVLVEAAVTSSVAQPAASVAVSVGVGDMENFQSWPQEWLPPPQPHP